MQHKVWAAAILAALAMPVTAMAQDRAVESAIIGGTIGVLVGAGLAAGVPPEQHAPLREYVVRERRPTYRYEREVVVGEPLPPQVVETYEVPPQYGIREHHYAIVNDRTVIVEPRTRRVIQVIE
jgi:hypothetical protein